MDLEPRDEDIPPGGNDGERTPGRRSRTLILLVGAGFIIGGGLDIVAYWWKCRRHQLDISAGHSLYLSIPLVIGVVIFIMSSRLARRIEEYLDE